MIVNKYLVVSSSLCLLTDILSRMFLDNVRIGILLSLGEKL